jgi:hypothetical protein
MDAFIPYASYVAFTKPNLEKAVTSNLTAKGADPHRARHLVRAWVWGEIYSGARG